MKRTLVRAASTLALILSAHSALAYGNNLAMTGASYGTSGQEFGSGDLTAGSGVTTACPAGTAAYAWEIWIKIGAAPSQTEVAMGGDGVGWLGVSTSGTFEYALGTGGGVTTSKAIADGNWHQLDLVQGSGTGTVYVDNVQVASASDTVSTPQSGIAIGSYRYDGSTLTSFNWTGATDEASCWNYARVPVLQSAPYQGTENGLVGLWHLDGNGSDSSAPGTTTFAPNNAALYYSPANWLVQVGSAETNQVGAYLRFYYSGSTPPTFDFNTANDTATPVANLKIAIDNQAPQVMALASTVTPTAPSTTTSLPTHFVDLSVIYIPENDSEWTTPHAGTPVLTGVTLPNTASLSPYTPHQFTTVIIGDSITAGLKTLGIASGYDDKTEAPITDGTLSAPFLLARDGLGTEVAEIADGGQWISPNDPTTSGAAAGQNSDGGWPPIPDALPYLWAGQTRTWPSYVRWVFVAAGTNDSGKGGNCAGIAEGVQRTMSMLRPMFPTQPIFFIEPYIFYTSSSNAAVQSCEDAAVTAAGAILITTAGMLQTALTSEGVHPLVSMNDILEGELEQSMNRALGARGYQQVYWGSGLPATPGPFAYLPRHPPKVPQGRSASR